MQPQDKDIAVILCHFNWCNFFTPKRNLHRFIRQMEIQGIPVYGIELSLNSIFETSGMKNWKHITVTQENICFQKEACINIVVNSLPSNITKIAWLDHDIVFTNQNWYIEASMKLEQYKVLQLYSQYTWTDKSGRKDRTSCSVAKACTMSDNEIMRRGSRGCAWAARRELWNNGGLYPFCYLGGGDTMFATVALGFFDIINKHRVGLTKNENFERFFEWRRQIESYIKPSDISYIDGEIIHDWHGDQDARKYGIRYDLVYGIDLSSTVSLDHNGLVKITSVSQEIYDRILKYFRDRNEDGLTNNNYIGEYNDE